MGVGVLRPVVGEDLPASSSATIQAGPRPRENITGGGGGWWCTPLVLTSPRPSATSRLRGTAGAPARRADHPPRAPLARSRRATRDLRAGSPPTPVGGEGGSPVPVPCRASPGPPDCQCAHCAPGLTPGPQEDCAVPDHRPLRDCDEALPRRAARARTAPLATCGSANDRCRPITSAIVPSIVI